MVGKPKQSFSDALKSTLESAGRKLNSEFQDTQGSSGYGVDLTTRHGMNPAINPFEVDPDTLKSLQAGDYSPFTVVDIETSVLGSGVYATQAGTNSAESTKSYLRQLLNIPNTSYLEVNGLGSVRQPDVITQFARTIEVKAPGNFLRVERRGVGVTGQFKSLKTVDGSPTVGLDKVQSATLTFPANPETDVVNAIMSLYSSFLQGIFVQFDSVDAPVFSAKSFENYKLPFNTVFITFFQGDLNWRVILGQQATITDGDDRAVKQQLHLWDGGGMLELPNVQPIPFARRANFAVVPNTAYPLASNYDNGSQINPVSSDLQRGGQGITSNKGFAVLWLTEITYMIQAGAAIVPADNIGVFKSVYCPAYAAIPPIPPVDPYRGVGQVIFDMLSYPQIAANTSFSFTKQFPIPKRVVLAGFNATATDMEVVTESGEVLFFGPLNSTSSVPGNATLNCMISGYVMGWIANLQSSAVPSVKSEIYCLPYNPYPGDCLYSYRGTLV